MNTITGYFSGLFFWPGNYAVCALGLCCALRNGRGLDLEVNVWVEIYAFVMHLNGFLKKILLRNFYFDHIFNLDVWERVLQRNKVSSNSVCNFAFWGEFSFKLLGGVSVMCMFSILINNGVWRCLFKMENKLNDLRWLGFDEIAFFKSPQNHLKMFTLIRIKSHYAHKISYAAVLKKYTSHPRCIIHYIPCHHQQLQSPIHRATKNTRNCTLATINQRV